MSSYASGSAAPSRWGGGCRYELIGRFSYVHVQKKENKHDISRKGYDMLMNEYGKELLLSLLVGKWPCLLK